MRFLVFFIAFFTLIHADEIKRLDSMVEDIARLQGHYQNCQQEMTKQKEMNDALKTQMASMQEIQPTTNTTQEEPFKNEIEALKKEVEKSKQLLSKKDKEIQKLNAQLLSQDRTDNEIPKLVMKEEDQTKADNYIYYQPTSYRLKEDSYIYDGVNGKKMAVWEKDTSFTSYMKKDDWVRITGYFVDKVWVSSKNQEMWIKASSIKPH